MTAPSGAGIAERRGGAPSLVEVAGVAGAGKTTVVRRLCADDERFRLGGFIHARDPRHLVEIARTLPRLLPILVRNLWLRPRLTWREVKLLVYASSWHRVLGRDGGNGVILLDQGPLYALVRLTANGAGVTRTPSFARWRDEVLDAWRGRLGAVVWLDADDAILVGRINGRSRAHDTKGRPDAVIRAFLARYRELFAELFDRIGDAGGPPILRSDTGAATAEEVAADVRRELSAAVASS